MVVIVRLAALYFLLLFLSACSNSETTASGEYLQRLQRVLDVKIDLQKPPTLDFPSARSLKFDQVESALTIREFLSLRQCKLHTIIAQRNSLIGKVAVPSQLLFNDLNILKYIPACIETLRAEKQFKLADKLVTYQQLKISNIDQALWQAILGQQENASFWRIRQQPLDYPQSFNNKAAESLRALAVFIEAVQGGDYDFDQKQSDQIEYHLQQLNFSDAGMLYRRLAELRTNLSIANQTIAARLEKPLCLTGLPTQKARYFKNVVNQFFIGEVQVDAVHLGQRYEQLLSDYLLLEQRLWKATPKVYQQWKLKRDQDLQLALSASKAHVSYIKKLFDQCGLSVGLG